MPALTPTAPATWPSGERSSTPPAKTTSRPSLVDSIPYSAAPGWTSGTRSRVSIWNSTAVSALRCEMFSPISLVSSIAAKATRLPPSSTTAMFIGWPTDTASALQASMIASACASVMLRGMTLLLEPQNTRMATSAGAASSSSISSSSLTRVIEAPAMSSDVQYSLT